MLQNFSLRTRVGFALGAAVAFCILLSSFIIVLFVERIVLSQAESSLREQVRDTELTLRLLTEGIEDQGLLKKRIETLRSELKSKRLLATGYYYILDPNGTFLLHPSQEGENVLNGTDLDGRPIFKQIVEMNEGTVHYRWLNSETKRVQEKLAVCKKTAALGWSVCASLNEGEVYAPVRLIRWATAAICLVLVLLLAPLAYFAASKLQQFLLRISKRLLGTATVLSASSRLIQNASSRITENSQAQSSSVHETVSAVDEIKSMSERNATNSEDSSTKVRDAVDISEKGARAVTSLSGAIDDIVSGNDRIQKQVEMSNQQLGNIVNVIREIDSKTRVINDIVFQTKLLSFNASVEAARAGENGKGFAVVAEEVGNLAQMSGRAAAEISTMLSANVADVEKLIRETQASVGKLIMDNKALVERGAREAQACGEAFTEMRTQIKTIEDLSSNIAVASKEQTKGVENIGLSMNHLNEILVQNNRISDETAAASEDLSDQNAALHDLAHELAWSILGEGARARMDQATEETIDAGLTAHAEWKNRLIQVLKGTSKEIFEPENVCKDDQCALGKWIYSQGQERYGRNAQFEALKSTHSDFHKVACEALRSALSGNQKDHRSLIGRNSQFDAASSQVIGNLVSLKFHQ